MPIVVASKADTKGTVTPSGLNVETTVYAPGVQGDDAIVEGEVSLQNLAAADTVVVTEYMSVDGTNFEILNQQTFSGVQAEPAIRLVTKLIGPKTGGTGGGQVYKVTVKQTAGTARAYPFWFVLQVLGHT